MKQKVNDYKQMLLDININQNQMDLITNTKNLIETSSDIYKKLKSNIHGIGIFANKKIKKNSLIGIASLNNTIKTTLGRWTNHNINNNAIFLFTDNLDILMFAIKEIKINEEILINYRDHILNPTIINIEYERK
jgi:SET domain-containing protein